MVGGAGVELSKIHNTQAAAAIVVPVQRDCSTTMTNKVTPNTPSTDATSTSAPRHHGMRRSHKDTVDAVGGQERRARKEGKKGRGEMVVEGDRWGGIEERREENIECGVRMTLANKQKRMNAKINKRVKR